MESSPVSNQSLPPGTRVEEFVIERVLGSGGFGITYLARDARLDRQVVIKENLPAQFCFRDTHSLTVAPRHSHGEDAENFKWSLENFSKEAAMLASLDHPGIVKVLRSFEAFGTAYFVMPYVEGVALDELVRSRHGKPFKEEELVKLLERALAALGYLHDRGIYHRDIKLGNLLITNEGIPVLIDFGSARQRLSERSMTVVESAGYTPFEQLQSRGNVGPWSDLYALGGTLVKLITGEAPPKAMDRMRKDPFLPLAERAELQSGFSRRFCHSIDQALVVDEENRWQDAGEWLAALRGDTSIEKSLPVLSREERPAIPAEPTGKRINPLPWIIAASVVVGLFALAKIGSKPEASIQNGRANTQATDTRAKEAEQRALQLEQEKQTLAEQQADLQRKAHEEEERRALAAQAKAKAKKEADAKAQAGYLSLPGTTAGEERDFEIAPGVKITMCWIPPGEFMMGSPAGELGRKNNETQHQVRISKGFWLAKTETTQAQWQAVMGNNPSHFKGQDLPVETVSWDDVAGFDGFIEKVNETATAGGRFALPTEAQWEYACRAGTTGADSGDIEQMAWYSKSSGYTTQPVAGKRSNAWGLHDMRGNVWEWCSDWYGEYTHGPATDPPGATSGSRRVVRGGSWSNIADYCRVTFRFGNNPAYSVNSGFGFRVARSSVP